MLKLGQQAEYNYHLHKALQLVIDLRSFNWASSVASIALLLAEQGQNARAVELYNLAKTDPLVSISHWFEDIVENPIATMTATLPSSIIKTSQIQGQMLDRWQTAKSLLQELGENSLETARNPNTKQLLPHNLPSQPTPFIGRSADLAALDTLFADPNTRLVTIVAAGGMGKTRLALAWAERVAEVGDSTHGVFFINLAPLSEAEQIVPALADGLDFQLQGGERSPRQQLLDYLRHKQMLLLFDNFEHLLDGVDLLSDILQAAPEVQLLVTSRERLHLRAEQLYPIKGLTFSDNTNKAIVETAAGRLFLQAARRNQPYFALHDDNDLAYLAHICRLVAGMPLALELAASWVDVLPLAKIAAELQQGLNFLETDLRDMPVRQRSIRAVINVSWQKLSAKEQEIFAQFSIFRGGFTRKAAQAITEATSRLLSRLNGKSFLQYDPERDRYQIHELLRQYGAEKLAANPQSDTTIRDHHSLYYCTEVGKRASDLRGPRQQTALAQIEADKDNMRVAWHWAAQQKHWPLLGKSVNALHWFYLLRGRYEEGMAACRQVSTQFDVVALSQELDSAIPRILAQIWVWQANFAWILGDGEAGVVDLQQSLALLEKQPHYDREIQLVKAHALHILGLFSDYYDDDLDAGREMMEQSLALYQNIGDQWGEAWCLRYLGSTMQRLNFKDEARDCLERSLALFRVLGDKIEIAMSLHFLSFMAIAEGHYQQATQLGQESLTINEGIDASFGKAQSLAILAWTTLTQGQLVQAGSYFEGALAIANDMGDIFNRYSAIIGQSCIQLHQGEYEEARTLAQEAFALKRSQLRYNRYFLSALGDTALALGEYDVARRYFQENVAAFTSGEQHFLIEARSVLGVTLLKLGYLEQARQQFYGALQLTLHTRSYSLPFLLAGIALFLAERGDKERAIALYTWAESHPLISVSRWFADVYGRSIATATSTLPSNIVKKAKTQGWALDGWQTAESLLHELGEDRAETYQSQDTQQVIPHNLPSQPTPFIGRLAELSSLHDLFARPDSRLITIVGAGGMGKTRLALAYGERQLTADSPFPHGVFFINLAPLSESEQIVSALTDGLNFQLQEDGRSPRQQLLDYLRHKKMLLLFDNFEHLLDSVDLLTDIMQAAPNVQILVTSRERLHLRAEQVYPIAGLALPDSEAGEEASSTAVQLFLQSARRNQPNFILHNDDILHLNHICHTVAGMPLALELVASWVDMLSLAEVAAELQHGLNFLETGMRDIPERHRSMRATIDRSWQKLTENEREIFAKLSVFCGGFTREAAQVVAGANLQQLARLMNKSFVQGRGQDGRYQIHELLRQYGLEKLGESGQETAVRDDHSVYFCEALQELKKKAQGSSQMEVAPAQVSVETGNIQMAWSWAVEHKKTEWLGLGLDGLCLFYSFRNLLKQGERLCQLAADKLAQLPGTGFTNESAIFLWARLLIRQAEFNAILYRQNMATELLQQAQEILDDPSLTKLDTRAERARLLHAMGNVTRGDWEATRSWYEQSLALYRQLDHPFNVALGLNQLAAATAKCGDYNKAIELGKESLALFQELDCPHISAIMLNFLGDCARSMGEFNEAKRYHEESLIFSQHHGLQGLMGEALWALGGLQLFQGSLAASIDSLQQSLTHCRQVENPFVLFHVLTDLGLAFGLVGHFDQATTLIEESIILAKTMEDRYRLSWSISVQAEFCAWTGQYEEAETKAQAVLDMGQQPIVSINPRMTRYRIAYPKRILGWIALTKESYHEAYQLLQESVAGYDKDISDKEYMAISLAALGRAAYGLGQRREAKQHLLEALRIVVKKGAFVPLLHLIPIISVVLIDAEDMARKERAVELYALAKRDPFVAKAQIFQDTAGHYISAATVASILPPDKVKRAKEQGKNLDWWQTAESLLTELAELGWKERP